MIERETSRLVVGENRRGLTERLLNVCERLADKAMFLNDLIASIIEAHDLRAMETNIANNVSNGGDRNHQNQSHDYD